MNPKNKIKHDITSFLFCPKKARKNFLEICRKSVDKQKKVQYNAKRPYKKLDIKYIEK